MEKMALFFVIIFSISFFLVGTQILPGESIVNSNNPWNSSLKINLANPTQTNDVQVKIVLKNFDYSKANSDGSDIRFYDQNNNPLPYWIELWNQNNSSIIWVKILNKDTTSITMYYGNPNAKPQSNGDNTFLFFDNFTGSSLDLSKWSIDQDQYSQISITSGILNLQQNEPDPGLQYTLIGFQNMTFTHGIPYGFPNRTGVYLNNRDLRTWDVTGQYSDTPDIIPKASWITGEIQWINHSLVKFVDNNISTSLTQNIPLNNLSIGVAVEGIINGPGTGWATFLSSKEFLAHPGMAMGFNYFQNSTYKALNEPPSLSCNWIYVRQIGGSNVEIVISQYTNVISTTALNPLYIITGFVVLVSMRSFARKRKIRTLDK